MKRFLCLSVFVALTLTGNAAFAAVVHVAPVHFVLRTAGDGDARLADVAHDAADDAALGSALQGHGARTGALQREAPEYNVR